MLIILLRNPNAAVRAYAAQVLEAVGPAAASAVPALRDALSNSSLSVRLNAARTLGTLGPAAQAAIPELEKCLEDPGGGGKVILEARRALEIIRGRAPNR